MRCLYCGKELALFKRLRGGEFCSDAHRQRYQEEYTQLALNRLMQANGGKEGEHDSGGAKPQELRPAEPESPAIKRRERAGREDVPAVPLTPSRPMMPVPAAQIPMQASTPASLAARSEKTTPLETANHAEPASRQTAVMEPELAPPLAEEPPTEEAPELEAEVRVELEETAAPEVEESEPEMEEPPPAGMASFLVEFPVPILTETAVSTDAVVGLTPLPKLILPRLNGFHGDVESGRLDRAAPVELSLFTVTDFQTPPKERGLELREFVRGVPQVEINVKPAVESGFEPVGDVFEVEFDAQAPDAAPHLWLASETEFPSFNGASLDGSSLNGGWGVELGDLARLDFSLTEWGQEAGAEAADAVADTPPGIGTARLEPLRPEPVRMAPVQHEPAQRASSRPEPVGFEPVHIDPVFIERIAGTPAFEAGRGDAGIVEEEAAAPGELEQTPEPAAVGEQAVVAEQDEAVAEAAVVAEQVIAEAAGIAEDVAPEVPVPEAPSITEPAPPAPPPEPASVTRPMPVTLHGLAPMRGKPVQVFTSAATRTGDLQIPRDTGLPLRPLMVFGLAPKPAAVEQKAPPVKPAAKSIPIPEKREARPDAPNRKTEVRVLPVQVRELKPESIKPLVPKLEPGKPETNKPALAEAKSKGVPKEVSKEVPPAQSKPFEPPKPVEAAKPAEAAKAVEPTAAEPKTVAKSAPKPVEAPKQGESSKPAGTAKPAPASDVIRPPAPVAKPSEEDLLGLPKLAFQAKEGFWSRLPAAARLGVIAAVLALVVGGVVLTSRGSGSAKPTAPALTDDGVMVEEAALANNGGWVQDWFADRAGGKQGRHVDVLRGSLTLRDYRLQFEGQIEQGALSWVFRASEKNFYVEKIQVVTPGLTPVMALVHFAVIDGKEQPRTQTPLPIQAHLDTAYKVRMDVIGSHFTTWVQDQQVDEWTDSQIGAGGVGLYYDSGESASLRDTLHVIPLRRK